jgi:hypothetical protein
VLCRVLPDCTISAVQPKAVGVARGMKQPEELTVCAEIQASKDKSSKRLVKTALCPNSTISSENMSFEFLNEFQGMNWKTLTIKKGREAAQKVDKRKKPTKDSLSDWSKDIGGGGIKKHNEM